jgi:hypothetical protein
LTTPQELEGMRNRVVGQRMEYERRLKRLRMALHYMLEHPQAHSKNAVDLAKKVLDEEDEHRVL